jgi:hypothetical protein
MVRHFHPIRWNRALSAYVWLLLAISTLAQAQGYVTPTQAVLCQEYRMPDPATMIACEQRYRYI